MSCMVEIATEARSDLLLYSRDLSSCQEIGDFLLDLQENPYLARCQTLDDKNSLYFAQLHSGLFITWQVIPARSSPLSIRNIDLVTVRVLAINRAAPHGSHPRPPRRTPHS